MILSAEEQQLASLLGDLPKQFGNRYTSAASNRLIQILFSSLAAQRPDYLQLLFPTGHPPATTDKRWNLREAQGVVEGAEYSEAARGHPCGHIFKSGEATYRCRTCSSDDTCVLCSKCFDSSDHEGHNVFVTLSPGNSGCCDCGDAEAWIRTVNCTIHTALPSNQSKSAGKAKEGSPLPPDLVSCIQMTISRALDYLCDVFSCAPEQLRLPKLEENVRGDERDSRLSAKIYNTSPEQEEDSEFCLILWNDEKHTVNDVRDQVARACRISERDALKHAHQVDDVGRSIVQYSSELPKLLQAAKIIEQPKLTVTVRSARDTFREQMCATMIEWISDIAGCRVGLDPNILRNTICEELLRGWRVGSEAHHQDVGKDGIDDHEVEDYEEMQEEMLRFYGRYPARAPRTWRNSDPIDDVEDSDSDDEDNPGPEEDEMDIDAQTTDMEFNEMDVDDIDPALETSEATLAGYPPPPPPPPQPRRRFPGTISGDSDEGDSASQVPLMSIPRTPKANQRTIRRLRPPKYWMDKPDGYRKQNEVPLAEDLWKRVRLDYLILWDLRMWKQLRTNLRDVFISTVVTLPHFKRLLGLRFAGVYTVLAELYLIADREPDHSIINLSIQMLTTPTITSEVVERGNFLTNLMAILYTFLTTRQVGYPSDVNLATTLAFDQGAVTNRRTFHFYMDMRYLLASQLVQEKVRSEDRYLMQFLDLAKLHQGICPNVRAVGEHVEFEADAWLSASIIVQEIIKLCRLVGECFTIRSEHDFTDLSRAIRNTARVAIVNSLGSERRRFDQAEIRAETRFKQLAPFEFDIDVGLGPQAHRVVNYVVDRESMSFHHALHYTLSWLIDKGKTMSREQILGLLLFSTQELRQAPTSAGYKSQIPDHQPEDHLLALFDFPLRVLAWLAQLRAGMWVRNGITLRHQMTSYRGFPRRELSYQRDIFMVQTAFAILPPATVLASVIDRFDITALVRGDYNLKEGKEEQQQLEVAEDFVHLLIILLSDRAHLLPLESDPDPQLSTARRDVVHNLCFKPLSYSSLCSHIADKFSDTDAFDQLVQEMTTFKPPEGVSDHGTFALKEQFYEEIDPYLSYFSRNQRDEAENIYRKHMATRLGKDPADIVYEPKLRPIDSGLFKELANFTRLPLFAQIIFYLLQYTMVADRYAPTVPSTKVEQFLQFILHLILIAIHEDKSEDDSMSGDGLRSFCTLALTKRARLPLANCDTIALLLRRVSEMETFKTCEPKVRVILRHLRHKRPNEYMVWARTMDLPVERSATASPMPSEDREVKKKQALDRQARVMAQFKQQQNSFLANQATIDWGDDEFSDLEDDFRTPTEMSEEKLWKYPSGNCILCQEETNEDKLYGTFALMNDSRILRQTNVEDADWVAEALETPSSLDCSAESIRPFGVAGHNRRKVQKVTADGRVIELERQELAKGFPYHYHKNGPVATGCGHIMHFTCFEIYLEATRRRHQTQIARNHPERRGLNEFLCPLCKALGNVFLPVIWKGKTIRYPGELAPEVPFEEFLGRQIGLQLSKFEKGPERGMSLASSTTRRFEKFYLDYGNQEMVTPIASRLHELTRPNTSYQVSPQLNQRQAFLGEVPVTISMSIDDAFISSSMLVSGMSGETTTTSSMSPQMLELIKVYQRLRSSMFHNRMPPLDFGRAREGEDLIYTQSLVKSLGFSISAAEIAQRGVESDPTSTLLDKISSQTVTHLRVLSETISSYLAIGGLRNGAENSSQAEFSQAQNDQMLQLFVGNPQICSLAELDGGNPSKTEKIKFLHPLLTQDAFIFLTECAISLGPVLHLDIHHLIRLCYFAEIVRVILALTDSNSKIPVGDEGLIFVDMESRLINFSKLVGHIESVHVDADMSRFRDDAMLERLYRLVERYALPFLRKCTILMHVRYGIDFPQTSGTRNESELARLSHTLRLPSLEAIIGEAVSSQVTMDMVTGWIKHFDFTKPTISLSHPAIFELVGLPKNFDSLQDEAMKRRCPTTGKDLTDPVVCLFCGDIFCSQAVCCQSPEKQGGAYQHRLK
jgi:E3 ubiquitin-protein ligase UBR1